MSNLRKNTIQLVISIITIIFTLCAFALVSYSWFASNERVTASGMKITVESTVKLDFEKDVRAIKYSHDGSTITRDFVVQNDFSLKLVKSHVVSTTDGTYDEDLTEVGAVTTFFFDEILPGEYVDITVSFKTVKENQEIDYELEFCDFDTTDGIFTIKNVDYNILGIFKQKPLSIKYYDKSDALLTEKTYDDTEYSWFSNYTPNVQSVAPDEVAIFNDKWLSTYYKATYSFRVAEDFTQYYDLVASLGVYVSNILSNKVFTVGALHLTDVTADKTSNNIEEVVD